jgi:hypothetical protein
MITALAMPLVPPALLAAAPPTLQLFTSEPPPPPAEAASDPWSMVLWIAASVLVLSVSAAVSIMAWRGRWRDPPLTRAANTLASALGLRSDAKATLRRLAEALGAEPVALLLSESAFERAAAALETKLGALNQRDKAAVLALRAHVFGVRHEADTARANKPQSDRERPPLNLAA